MSCSQSRTDNPARHYTGISHGIKGRYPSRWKYPGIKGRYPSRWKPNRRISKELRRNNSRQLINYPFVIPGVIISPVRGDYEGANLALERFVFRNTEGYILANTRGLRRDKSRFGKICPS